jgi:hypothetical protein
MSPLIFQGHAAKTTQIFGLHLVMSSSPATKLSVKPTIFLSDGAIKGSSGTQITRKKLAKNQLESSQ